MKNIKNKRGAMAISQIIILILGIVAISYAIGSELKPVSADAGANTAALQTLMNPSTLNIPASPTSGWGAIKDLGNGNFYLPSSTGTPIATPATPAASTAGTNLWKTMGANIVNGMGAIITNAIIAGVLWAAFYFIPTWVGASNAAAWQAASWYIAGGYALVSIGAVVLGGASLGLSIALGGIGAVFGFLLYAFTPLGYTSATEIVSFSCQPWLPASGGNDCTRCGQDGRFPCTKYECESLGQSCTLLNEGTGRELCTWLNRNDANPPTITPWIDALPDKTNYAYTPATAISPQDKGVIVKYLKSSTADGCIPAFSVLSFGMQLDKPSTCKASSTRTNSYDSMTYSFSSGMSLYNHSVSVSLPGIANLAEEGLITLNSTGQQQIYVRCNSSNGVANTANFVFKFCLDSQPDTSAPIIEQTDIPNNSPIRYQQNSTPLQLYLNEPAECKWSHSDKNYDNMEGTFSCAKSVKDISYIGGQMLYKCSGTLNGLQSNANNNFYFRCKDQPLQTDQGKRNTMTTSYKYTLVGTQPLAISSVSPASGSLLKGASNQVQVTLETTTAEGYSNGKATCSYNELCYNSAGNGNNFIQFAYPAGTTAGSQIHHTQSLWLPAGDYACSIKCCDLGGNCDTKQTSYTVKVDNVAPVVVRAYYESPNLNLGTNEEANCVYDTTDCTYNFDDGIKITTTDNLNHQISDVNPDNSYYIKCKDNYGNFPLPNSCTIVIKPLSLS